MLLLKIDSTPGHAADFDPIEVATAPNLSELIQLRRDRIRGTRQDAYDLPSPKLTRYRDLVAGASCEYRDEDLISVLDLGEEFLVFVTDDGHAPYLFRIVVEASKIDKVLTGGQVGSGELSVARFVANGVMIWLSLPRAIRSSIYETAGRLGATVLGSVERTELLPLATSLRLTLRGGIWVRTRSGTRHQSIYVRQGLATGHFGVPDVILGVSRTSYLRHDVPQPP